MSVVGFDFGNESCVVAVARLWRIDVVLNNELKRKTPAIVCFGEKQRFIGTVEVASAMMNPKNTISQIKRLIGRQWSDHELQRDLKSLPFSVTEGPDGFPLIHVRYLGEMKAFTPTQVLGMFFSKLKGIAEKNLNATVFDCCIGIPVYFTDLQRRAVLDAATIAGLYPLRLIHKTTATALDYGIYKTDLPENDPINVAFVDIGHSSMQVCIAAFKKAQLKVLAHSFDRSLGGRDFDEVLFQHFAAKFKDEYKIDVYQNARACLRLRAACEKLKKVLSANLEAPLNIECLMDEKDVQGFIKRDEFEQISLSILERVKKPLEKALEEAGLAVENIHAIEVVGSASRVPAITKILTEFFGKEPRRTMNASECVSKGCALECAILSPTFKVKEFQVIESFPFPVSMSWKGNAREGQTGTAEGQQATVVIPKGSPIPCLKAVTILRSGTLSVDLHYADTSELQAPAKISTYTIGPFQSAKGDPAKLKIRVRLNLHGIVSVDSATLLEEGKIVTPVVKEPAKEAAKMDTDDAPSEAATAETDVNMRDAKGNVETPGVQNGVPESGEDPTAEANEKPVQMDTDAKTDGPKKKVKKRNAPVSDVVYGGLLPTDVQKAVGEFEMALQDQVMEETKDQKSAMEALAIVDDLVQSVTYLKSEVDAFTEKAPALNATEDKGTAAAKRAQELLSAPEGPQSKVDALRECRAALSTEAQAIEAQTAPLQARLQAVSENLHAVDAELPGTERELSTQQARLKRKRLVMGIHQLAQQASQFMMIINEIYFLSFLGSSFCTLTHQSAMIL